jgi:hypothetical protein
MRRPVIETTVQVPSSFITARLHIGATTGVEAPRLLRNLVSV